MVGSTTNNSTRVRFATLCLIGEEELIHANLTGISQFNIRLAVFITIGPRLAFPIAHIEPIAALRTHQFAPLQSLRGIHLILFAARERSQGHADRFARICFGDRHEVSIAGIALEDIEVHLRGIEGGALVDVGEREAIVKRAFDDNNLEFGVAN